VVTVALAVSLRPAAAGADPGLLEPELLDRETFAETFTAIADLQDGTYVQTQVAVTNAGPGDGKGACRVLVVRPGVAPWTATAELDRSDWSFSARPVPTLRMGTCRWSSGDRLEAAAAVGMGRVQVVLQARPRRVRPPDHQVKVGDDFYRSEVLVPWAPATVELALPGRPARTLRGHGYADHSRATALPGEVATRWVRFRGLHASRSFLLLARFPPGGGPPRGWTWRQGEPAPAPLGTLRIYRTGGTGTAPTWRVHLGGPVGRKVVEAAVPSYRYDPVGEHGLLGRMVGAVVGRPVTWTLRAVLSPGPGGSPLPGILEVTDVEG